MSNKLMLPTNHNAKLNGTPDGSLCYAIAFPDGNTTPERFRTINAAYTFAENFSPEVDYHIVQLPEIAPHPVRETLARRWSGEERKRELYNEPVNMYPDGDTEAPYSM